MYRNWGYLNPRHVYHGDKNHQLNKKEKDPNVQSCYLINFTDLQASRMMDRGREGIQVRDWNVVFLLSMFVVVALAVALSLPRSSHPYRRSATASSTSLTATTSADQGARRAGSEVCRTWRRACC